MPLVDRPVSFCRCTAVTRLLLFVSVLFFSVTSVRAVELQVAVIVSGRAHSDRSVLIHAVAKEASKIAEVQMARGLDRRRLVRRELEDFIASQMILEEARIVGGDNIAQDRVRREFEGWLKKVSGSEWTKFQRNFDVDAIEMTKQIRDRLIVEDALLARLRDDISGNPSAVLKSWLEQLRARYRVHVLE